MLSTPKCGGPKRSSSATARTHSAAASSSHRLSTTFAPLPSAIPRPCPLPPPRTCPPGAQPTARQGAAASPAAEVNTSAPHQSSPNPYAPRPASSHQQCPPPAPPHLLVSRGAEAEEAVDCTRRTAHLLLSSIATAAVVAAARPAAATADAGSSNGSTTPPGSWAAAADGGSSRFTTQSTSPAGQQQLDRQWTQQPQQQGAAGEVAVPRRERRSWAPVPLVTLTPGLRVSKVIRGCWQLSGRHHGELETDRTSGGEAVSDMLAFNRAGITTMDTADNYGPSEALVGQYVRLHPSAAATTTITTKLSYVSEEEMAGVNRTLVEYAVRGALVRQGRQRLDLVQLQWADPVRHRRWLDVLKWLAELREQGLIGHLGLCNFGVPHLAKAVDAGVGVVSNQVQYSLIDRRPQLYMQQAAASNGIKLLAYGTVAGGLLADKYHNVPAGRVRLDTASKQKYGLVLRQSGAGAAAGSGGGWGWMQEVLEATRTVAARHGVSSSAVAIAWVLHQPQVAAAIVGARNTRHVRDMQAACSLVLDDGDMLDLDAVWEGVPNPQTSDVYVWERGGHW